MTQGLNFAKFQLKQIIIIIIIFEVKEEMGFGYCVGLMKKVLKLLSLLMKLEYLFFFGGGRIIPKNGA